MRGDIHIHSKYSLDSSTEPEIIIKTAKSIGLDFIAISDHNRFVKNSDDLLILPAEEVSSIDGHILALFIDDEIPSGLSQEETVESIHQQNGIAICAHPYRRVNGVGSRFRDVYDAIETRNGRCTESCNAKSESLALRLNKPGTAGSDAHFYEEIGRAFMEVDGTDTESIRSEILKGNCRTFGKSLSYSGQLKLYAKLGKEYISRGFKRI